MEYVVTHTVPLYQFPAWSGAKTRLAELSRHPTACDYIEEYLDEWAAGMPEGDYLSDTDINDFLWFDMEEMLAEAGYYDPETDEYTEAAN